jgi:hypothetical protein
MGQADLSKLIKYSQEKFDKLQEIKQLTGMQKDAIDEEDINKLNNLVAQKQKIIDYIDWCDSSFQKELEQMKEHLGIKNLAELKEKVDEKDDETLVGIIKGIVTTIEEIQDMEKENHAKLLSSMEQIKERLKRVRKGKKGLGGYNRNAVTVYGSFIDKKK